jgi:hypothetical protein
LYKSFCKSKLQEEFCKVLKLSKKLVQKLLSIAPQQEQLVQLLDGITEDAMVDALAAAFAAVGKKQLDEMILTSHAKKLLEIIKGLVSARGTVAGYLLDMLGSGVEGAQGTKSSGGGGAAAAACSAGGSGRAESNGAAAAPWAGQGGTSAPSSSSGSSYPGLPELNAVGLIAKDSLDEFKHKLQLVESCSSGYATVWKLPPGLSQKLLADKTLMFKGSGRDFLGLLDVLAARCSQVSTPMLNTFL